MKTGSWLTHVCQYICSQYNFGTVKPGKYEIQGTRNKYFELRRTSVIQNKKANNLFKKVVLLLWV